MRQYHRRRVEVQSTFDHFPGMDLGAVNRATKESLMGDKLVLIIQIQHPELFPLKRGHMQSQPFMDSMCGGEGHPGLMQMPVQNSEGTLDETPRE